MKKLPSLKLSKLALNSIESGGNNFLHSVRNNSNFIISTSGNKINILNEELNLLQTLSFDSIFPIHSINSNSNSTNSIIQSISIDKSTGRLAACSNGRIGIWEPIGKSVWRIHSSFTILHSVTCLDYARGRIVAGGNTLSIWELDESQAWPTWNKIGSDSYSSLVTAVKLSPSGQLLASVASKSNIVRIFNIKSNTTSATNSLESRSKAYHSLPVQKIDWRTTDDPADSGPVLYTTTRDGSFHIWGCMIDEPDFFSLWATLDVQSSLPFTLPLSTSFFKTIEMWPSSLNNNGEENSIRKKGTSDEFITVLSDGSVHSTIVSNFDCRPPTCLSQSTTLLQTNLYTPSQLPNLRFTTLIPSTTAIDEFTLLSRCSRGTFLQVGLSTNPQSTAFEIEEDSLKTLPAIKKIEINSTGIIKELITSFSGESLLVLGNNKIIQNWAGSSTSQAPPQETLISEIGLDEKTEIASWDNGQMLVTANSKGLKVLELQPSGRLLSVSHLPDSIPPLSSFFIARSALFTTRTTIIAITVSYCVQTWTYDSTIRKVILGLHHDFQLQQPMKRFIKAVPIPSQTSLTSNSLVVEDDHKVQLMLVDQEGNLVIYKAGLADLLLEWKEGSSIKTGLNGIEIIACNCESVSAIISKDSEGVKLSIWDSKSSEFTSGQQFSQFIDGEVLDLKWSSNGLNLAIATSDRVTLHCAQRLDDLSGNQSWTTIAEIKLDSLTASPISAMAWISNGLAISSDRFLFFFSSLLTSGEDCHKLASDLIGPLPMHHPQLLFQSLLHGETAIVIRILIGLADQLTDEGDLTPLTDSKRSSSKITIDDFLESSTSNQVTANNNESKDIFQVLTQVAAKERGTIKTVLTEEDTKRLLSALKKCSMKGLNEVEHAHLAVVVQTVYEIQRQQGSLDSNGLCYLISMRSFFIYNASTVPVPSTLSNSITQPSTNSNSNSNSNIVDEAVVVPRLKYRDVVWAFHSESQDVLVEASIKACPAEKLSWENAKALGLFLWIKNPVLLATQMESVGKIEYLKNEETRDPITASLFYLALRKKHMVSTFWKQAGGHSDQRSMLKFLVNDFELPRWKSAALKNAFVLMSNRRFLFAAVFFLLGDSLKDAVSVCLRQLNDFQLAIAITRVYEGDDGPVFKSILEGTVLPLAFKNGYRWLSSWAFWKLNRRDLAIQTIVTPLRDLAERLPYQFESVGSAMHEDPALVLLFAQLRTWSLQTVKGAIAVAGHTEFNFVLHMSRVLCRMGCHILALKLVQSWEFYQPPAARRPSIKHPLLNRHSLRRMSTKIDIDIPSNLGSRAPSPDREGGAKEEFHSVLKKAKVETKAPAEFNFDNFQF